MSFWEVIIGLSIPIFGVLGVIYTARQSRKSAQENALAPDWSKYANEVGAWADKRLSERDEWTEKMFKERDDRISRIVAELNETKTVLNSTKDEVRTLTAKYGAAISYVRLLVAQLRNHVEPKDIEAPPDEIQLDL